MRSQSIVYLKIGLINKTTFSVTLSFHAYMIIGQTLMKSEVYSSFKSV